MSQSIIFISQKALLQIEIIKTLEKIQKVTMSEVQINDHEGELTQAQKIATQTTAKDYFLTQEQDLLEEWGQKSLDLFKFTADVFMKEYEIKSTELVEKYNQKYRSLYDKCALEFHAYCLLNRKVQKKNDEISNFSAFFNAKNCKKSFFEAWKHYSVYQKYLRSMEDRCDKYRQIKTLKNCLKSWNEVTMKNNRMKIKNQVLHKTEVEITKVQEEYEKIIRTLEETLQKKLTELKKQQEQHKLLHEKYQNMYARNKLESGISH